MKTSTRSRIVALALTLSSTFAATSAFADYHVTAFSDTAGFRALLSEDAAAAKAAFASRRIERMDYFEANNLCVSQILTEEFEAAITSCSSAIDKMEFSSELSVEDEKVALAAIHSNLAVAKAMSGDVAGASIDLEIALSLNAKDGNASMNYDLLSTNLIAGS